MKNKIFYISIVLLAIISCKEEGHIYYLDEGLPAPKQISNVVINNTPGGAIITYEIPKDPNLSYIKAIYEIQPDVFREAKSSYYRDTLELVGFGDTLSHIVKIYSVGRNEKMSDPLSINVKPLTPPVQSVFESIDVESTFGGVSVSFINTNQADLAMYVMIDTIGNGIWTPVSAHYTSAVGGVFHARGLDPVESKFAVFIRDRWNNKSDTLFKVLTPLEETLILKSPWNALHLEGDSWVPEAAKYNLEKVWDNVVNNSENLFAPKFFGVYPQWFTVDLYQTVIFSRMKLFQRTSHPYNGVWIKSFEIWGTNDYSSDNWILLGQFESRIPSGSIWPSYKPEDMDYQRAGEDFSFNQPLPPIRYFRFKVTDTYGGGKYQLSELTFWGQLVQ